MDPEVAASSPPSQAADIMRKAFAPEAIPQAPEVEADEAPFDPATIKIPDWKTAVDGTPKALDKVRNKTLVEIGQMIENTDRWGHEKATEAANSRRENEDLRTRLAAAEQYARMNPAAPPPPPPDHWQQFGQDPNEAVITDGRRVLDHTLSEAERRAGVQAEAAAKRAVAEYDAGRQKEAEGMRIIAAFEMARGEVSKMLGREVPQAEWEGDLQDIARLVQLREPERLFDHKAYVETYVRNRGVPKATIPTEGNPPLSARTSSARSEVPTTTRENRDLKAAIGRALGKDKLGDAYKDYV